METLQNFTETNSGPGTTRHSSSGKELTIQQQQYIDFCAVNGLITEDDGALKPMKLTEFAELLQVSRQTLYDWKKLIPDFWEQVHKRRKELGGQNRITKVYNGLYLRAAAGDARAAAIWLANHDPKFRMPAQKVEHEVGDSWAALLSSKRKQLDSGVVEGEVLDVPRAD